MVFELVIGAGLGAWSFVALPPAAGGAGKYNVVNLSLLGSGAVRYNGMQSAPVGRAIGRPMIQVLPKDSAVATRLDKKSHWHLSLARWIEREAVLPSPPATLEAAKQFATLVSHGMDMQYYELNPKDSHKLPFTLIPSQAASFSPGIGTLIPLRMSGTDFCSPIHL